MIRGHLTEGIPDAIPNHPGIDWRVDHAPVRRDILSEDEKRLALHNALRYFPADTHEVLAAEFADEHYSYGRIYMHRYRPTDEEMRAYPIDTYPSKSHHAAAIMMMIQNNLDPQVAQFLSLIHISEPTRPY